MDLIKRISGGQIFAGAVGWWRVLTSKPALTIAKIVLTIAFIFFANRKLDSKELSHLWVDFQLIPFFFAASLGIAVIMLHIIRWRLLLVYEGFRVSYQDAAKTFLFGLLLAFVTPGRLGELLRGVGISEKNKASTMVAVIIDKLFTVAAIFLFAFCCVLVQSVVFGQLPHIQFSILTAVAATISLAGLFLVARGSIFKDQPFFKRYRQRLLRVSPQIFSKTGARISLLTLIAHLCLITQTVVVFQMFGNVPGIKGILAAGQAYAFMTLMPFFMANMGIREYSFQLFLQQLYPIGEAAQFTGIALNASIVILVLNLILPALIGLIWSLLPTHGRRNEHV